eukprot:222237_1
MDIEYIKILNIDTEESSITANELITTVKQSNQYILSDADEELIILAQFQQSVNLQSIQFFASHISNNDIDASAPKQLHIYKLDNMNKNFDDITSMKPDKSVICSNKKLRKGQKIKLKSTSKNAIKFKTIKYLAIYVESNQNDTEKTYITGIKFILQNNLQNRIENNSLYNELDTNNQQKLRKLSKLMATPISTEVDSSYLLGYVRTNSYSKENIDENVVNKLLQLQIATRDQIITASSMTDNYKDVNAVLQTLQNMIEHNTFSLIQSAAASNNHITQDKNDCLLRECKHFKNVATSLFKYHQFISNIHNTTKNDIDASNDFNQSNYNNNILNDFHHLLRTHEADDEA